MCCPNLPFTTPHRASCSQFTRCQVSGGSRAIHQQVFPKQALKCTPPGESGSLAGMASNRDHEDDKHAIYSLQANIERLGALHAQEAVSQQRVQDKQAAANMDTGLCPRTLR